MFPLQFGAPGGPEIVLLLFYFVIPVAAGYWTYRNAKKRGSKYAANWGISMALFALLGFFPVFVGLGLYFAVRDEFERS